MKNITSILTLCVLIVFISTSSTCKNEEEAQRDKLIFEESVGSVESAIETMNSLMDKLTSTEIVNYFFDDYGNFYINSEKLGQIDSIDVDTVSAFGKLTNREKHTLVSTVQFLKRNHLSSVFKDKPCKCYLYSYKAVSDKSFNMTRDVYLKEKGKNYETLFAQRKVLDTKKNLVLIGPDK